MEPESQTPGSQSISPQSVASNTVSTSMGKISHTPSRPSTAVLADTTACDTPEVGEGEGDVPLELEPLVDDIAHLPPYGPPPQHYHGFGRSLRETVIWKQSTRTLPPDDRFLERMEDRFVRWSAPQSAFKVDDILNGRHLFQKTDVPMMEVLSSSTVTQTGTDSEVESVIQMPMFRGTLDTLRGPSKMLFFPEHIDDAVAEDGDALRDKHCSDLVLDTASIQDSMEFSQDYVPLRSASMSSSIRLKIATSAVVRQDDSRFMSPPTVEAVPIDENDIALFVKDQPQAQGEMRLLRLHFDLVGHPQQPLFCDDVGMICAEMWMDFWHFITCKCDTTDDETRLFYLGQR